MPEASVKAVPSEPAAAMRPRWRGWLAATAAAGLALLAALGAAPARAQDVLPVPALSGRVIDQTGTLDAAQRQALDAKLAALERETGSQVVVLLVPTTSPEDIAAYAQRVADQWKIGRRAVGDGVLLVSAQQDRKLRIEVAKTLEGAIPDLTAARIIDQQLRPAFRAGDFAGGLNQAVDQLAARIRGEALPAPRDAPATARTVDGLDGHDWGELAIFFFAGVPLLGAVLTGALGRKVGALLTSVAAGGGGWWLTASAVLGGAAALLALVIVGVLGIGAASSARGASRAVGRRGGGGGNVPVVWGGGFGGSGGGGSSFGGGSSDSGGGFSSGGGGDFGGGGASGDW